MTLESIFSAILPVIVGVVAGFGRAIADGRFVPPEQTKEGIKLHEASQVLIGGIGGFLATVFYSSPEMSISIALAAGLGLMTLKDIAAKHLKK